MGDDSQKTLVSMVVPVKEIARLGYLLTRVETYRAAIDEGLELVLCGRVPGRFAGEFQRVVEVDSDRKGRLMRAGVLASRGEIILLCDDDLPVHPKDVQLVVRALTEADVVLGNRYLPESAILTAPAPIRRVASWVLRVLVRLVFELKGFDTQCGLKGMTRNAASPLFSRQIVDGFAFDIELVLKAIACGMRILQVPVQWQSLPESTISVPRAAASIIGEILALRRAAPWIDGSFRRLLEPTRSRRDS